MVNALDRNSSYMIGCQWLHKGTVEVIDVQGNVTTEPCPPRFFKAKIVTTIDKETNPLAQNLMGQYQTVTIETKYNLGFEVDDKVVMEDAKWVIRTIQGEWEQDREKALGLSRIKFANKTTRLGLLRVDQ